MSWNCKAVLLAVVLLTSDFFVFGQSFDYPYIEDFGAPNEYLLAAPNPNEGTQLLPVGIDLYNGNDVNSIYYGLTPANSSSRPVLVFVHGYASNASVWYTGDDNMYKDVYQDGYRTAFVSLTPNRHIWTNGFMLNRSLNTICQHYGVQDVVLVGWSKGGVDCDAAVNHFGASNRVSEIFTLSTPHNGTGIAELANSVLLSLVNVIFWQNNDATRSLTRGYMSYFRSITDNLPGNTTPFTTFGAWGNGPLNRLDIPQGFLHLIDGSKASGGNDGVVPYQSSRRPGGTELFSGQRKEYGWFGIPYYPGPSQTELDHFEVTRGGLVWPYLKAELTNSSKQSPARTPANHDPHQQINSQMQVLASEGGNDTFTVGKDDKEITIRVLGVSEETEISIRNLQSKTLATITEIQYREAREDIPQRLFSLEGLTPGSYQIEANGNWAAFVESPEGPEARLSLKFRQGKRLFEESRSMQFELSTDYGTPGTLKASAVLQRNSDLQLAEVSDQPLIVPFTFEDGVFSGQASHDLPPGIYTLSVTLNGPEYGRTLIHSFAKSGASEPAPFANDLEIFVGPNPSSDVFNIRLSQSGIGELKLYNIFGQEVQSFSASQLQGEIRLDAKAQGLAPGLYILEWKLGPETVSEKLILR